MKRRKITKVQKAKDKRNLITLGVITVVLLVALFWIGS